jgi:hypothetical protein
MQHSSRVIVKDIDAAILMARCCIPSILADSNRHAKTSFGFVLCDFRPFGILGSCDVPHTNFSIVCACHQMGSFCCQGNRPQFACCLLAFLDCSSGSPFFVLVIISPYLDLSAKTCAGYYQAICSCSQMMCSEFVRLFKGLYQRKFGICSGMNFQSRGARAREDEFRCRCYGKDIRGVSILNGVSGQILLRLWVIGVRISVNWGLLELTIVAAI